jgi:hypothetical protein
MSVREAPVANRVCDAKDKDRAYKKHIEAVASAKTTIDTSSPEMTRRTRVKAEAHSRQAQRRPPRESKQKNDGPEAESDSDYDHLPHESVKIGFTENPVIEIEKPSPQKKPPSRSKIPSRKPLPDGPPKAELVNPEDPQVFPTQETSFKRSIKFEDDFLEDEEPPCDQGFPENDDEDEPLPPRPKTAPRTPRSGRSGNSQLFNEAERLPELGDAPNPDGFDILPDLEFPDI